MISRHEVLHFVSLQLDSQTLCPSSPEGPGLNIPAITGSSSRDGIRILIQVEWHASTFAASRPRR